ncbi:hypothetical protein GJU40_14665 [Bacillus lacus]|uniref:DUF5105 domain-containing protein n=1 Tax=Metabacillus lacus TaxID=1983721 RepID=A0A7X2J168_9BACI|nr:hypothetical protein [Metabacillus lacus]MRX73389.1 hypothetical protein [Metabacillus lacus]
MNRKWIFLIAAAAAVIGVFLVYSLQQADTPKKTLDQFITAVDKKQMKELKELIIPDDQQAEVNNISLTAFIQYLQKNNSSYQVIKESLNEQVKNEDFTETGQQVSLIEDGKKWGIFQQYKIKVKTAFIKVTGQEEGDELNLSIKGINTTSNEKDEDVYGPVLPGDYPVLTTINNKLGTFIDESHVEAWGNKQVTLVVDSNKLAREDENIKKNILEALDVFNRDFSVYQTSEFDFTKMTNVSKKLESDILYANSEFEMIKEYIDELHSQYLGAVVNLDDLIVDQFDQEWTAQVSALVAYDSKVKYREDDSFHDASYKVVTKYKLTYDAEAKSWLIDEIKGTVAEGTEDKDWKNKQEMMLEDPPVMIWSRTTNEISI